MLGKKKKIHFVESCSFPRSLYKNVTDDTKFVALKEAARNFQGKKHLNESSNIETMKKKLAEARIDETIQKQVIKNLQEVGANVDEVELWQFPVSKINTKESPNSNGRVYGRRLWENVIQKQTEVW